MAIADATPIAIFDVELNLMPASLLATVVTRSPLVDDWIDDSDVVVVVDVDGDVDVDAVVVDSVVVVGEVVDVTVDDELDESVTTSSFPVVPSNTPLVVVSAVGALLLMSVMTPLVAIVCWLVDEALDIVACGVVGVTVCNDAVVAAAAAVVVAAFVIVN